MSLAEKEIERDDAAPAEPRPVERPIEPRPRNHLQAEQQPLPPPLPDRPDDHRPQHRLLAALVSVSIILIVALAVGAIGFWLPSLDRDVPPTPPPPVNVMVMPVAVIPNLPDTFELPGVVEPNEVIRVAAEVSAQVRQYGQWSPATTQPAGDNSTRPLKEGDIVRAGQPIIYLDTELLRAELDQAEAQNRFDEHELNRIRGLHERNLATRQEIEQTVMRASLSRAALDAARTRFQRTVIVSPLDGVLNRLPAKIGEYVQPGTVVAEIVDNSKVKIIVDVPELDIGYFSRGDLQTIIPRRDNRSSEGSFTGPITYISELADPNTRTTRVELTVGNGQHLKSGQIVIVRLQRQTLTNVIMVPLEAVIPTEFTRNGEKIRLVYVVEPVTQPSTAADSDEQASATRPLVARERRITLGRFTGQAVQVTSGLTGGETVIVSGHRFVSDGQRIRVVQSGEPVLRPRPDGPTTQAQD